MTTARVHIMFTLSSLALLAGHQVSATRHYFDYNRELNTGWAFEGVDAIPPCSLFQGTDIRKISVPDNGTGNLTDLCRFAPSLLTCSDQDLDSHCFSDHWFCAIPRRELCSGVSICLTDECDCPGASTGLFYCGDGVGCVSLDLTCDGKYDCLDKSDELVCDGLVDVTCPRHELPQFSQQKAENITVTFSKFQLCSKMYGIEHFLYPYGSCNRSICEDLKTKDSKLSGYEMMSECFQHLLNLVYEVNDDFDSYINFNITAACLENCQVSASWEVCQNLAHGKTNVIAGSMFTYDCGARLMQNNETEFQQISPERVCNGVFDCEDKSDELHCPEVSWVSLNAKCNSYKDCENGLDECDNCTDGLLSSDQYIVRNHAVFAWLIVSCLGNLILNAYIFWDNLKTEFKGQENYVKVDRVLKLQISAYDIILGCYLLALILANLKYWGKYCLADDSWRSGWICKSLGVIFNFSSHGSLLSVLMMSITRAHKCTFSYSQGIRLRAVVISSIFIGLLNLGHSIIPVIPSESIQNIFRTKLTVSQFNPFIMRDFDNSSHIDRIYSQYFKDKTEMERGLYEKFEALKTITNRPEFFGYTELSFYSWSPVCVQDLYGYRDSLKVYKAGYITIVTAVLVSLILSYVKIVKVFLESRRKVGPRSGGGEDEGAKIKLKVALIIGTKLASWLTIMVVMVFYHFTGKIVPNGWFEVTAIVVVPANSLANPIFNSEITRSVRSWCKKRFCPFPAKDPKGHVIELQLVDNINNPGKEESPKGKQE
ncbi:hypothetical protein ACHWQZ_G019287 [Mnemiopsis leidyi]